MRKATKVIAIEEHFSTPEFDLAGPRSIYDLGEKRISDMDRFGVDIQVLSLTGPGVQGETDAATAIKKAKRTNDLLAEVISRYPTRFSGFACLPTQDPNAAATELERGVRQLGLKGAMIHGHTQGRYLDERMFDPLWERAEALDVPLYLHPADPYRPWHPVTGYPELSRAVWGWHAETGAHALRIICGGVFDRFPKAQLILGHLGETIPLYLWRIDSRMREGLAKRGLKWRKPSEYFTANIVVTTSGVFADAPLVCAITAIGAERIMFSADYPYENTEAASRWLAALPLPHDQIEAISHLNAERLLRL